ERFRPALMSVPSNHVGNDEDSPGPEGALRLFEKVLQVDDMMQEIIRDHGVVFLSGVPPVQIALNKREVTPQAGSLCCPAAAFEHRGVQIEAVENETIVTQGSELAGEFELQVAIARAEADETPHAAFLTRALLRQVPLEDLVGTVESARHKFR